MLIQSMETFAAAKERPQSRIWAEQATLRALVNSYLRETRQFDPRFDPRIDGQAQEMRVILPQLGRQIGGTLDHFSVTGQHVYGDDWYEVEEEGDRRRLGIEEVMQSLLDELGHRANSEQREVEQQNMKQRIHNSLHKMTLFMDRHLKLASGSTSTGSSQEVHLMYVDSEQSLLMGHPFHPYPKSTEGFMEDELPLYSPEMSAVFQLYYFAVHQDHVQEEWLGEQHRRDAIDPSVRLHAQRQWGEELEHFCILPMHPWQAEHVLHQPHIQSLILERRLIPMGVLGPAFYPISSIRTVWNVETGNGYKLPLHVRITNLVRDNTQEQARRTLDAAKVIHHLAGEWSSYVQSDAFKVLTETGYTRVCFKPDKETEGLGNSDAKYDTGQESESDPVAIKKAVHELEQLSDQLTVLYRPMDVNPESTYVMASLLEPLPGEQEPRLIGVIRDHSPAEAGEQPSLSAWLERYLHVSMVPMLRLLAVKGIAFEAHVQNSLLSLQDGWPECCYVRDLEGVSIVREQAETAGWVGTLVSEDSPVLYDAQEPWLRTRYYFFVNHLGALIHALAVHQQHSEQEYWRVVRKVLKQLQAQIETQNAVRVQRKPVKDSQPDADTCARLAAYIQDLLTDPTLPAKANFISCFQSKGDTPSFIPIPNPIHIREVTS